MSARHLSSLLWANGDVAHTAQVYVLAGAIFHSDVENPTLRNIDLIAAAVTAVPTTVVVLIALVVVASQTAADVCAAERIRTAHTHTEGSAADRSIRGVQDNGLTSGKLDAFYVSSRSAVT